MLNLSRDIRWPLRAGSLDLSPGEIQVWFADLVSFLGKFPQGLFSDEELTRANEFRFTRDAQLFLARRGLLRCLLAAYLEISSENIAFLTSPHGKPCLANPGIEELWFSTSHSSTAALFAFSRNGEVGVDLEKERDDLDPLELAVHFFAPAEISTLKLMAAQERRKAFFRTWTRKESWLKAVGHGLSLPLTDFQVSIEPGDSTLLDCPSQYGRSEDWHLIDLQTCPGFAATLAWKTDCTTLYSGTILAN